MLLKNEKKKRTENWIIDASFRTWSQSQNRLSSTFLFLTFSCDQAFCNLQFLWKPCFLASWNNNPLLKPHDPASSILSFSLTLPKSHPTCNSISINTLFQVSTLSRKTIHLLLFRLPHIRSLVDLKIETIVINSVYSNPNLIPRFVLSSIPISLLSSYSNLFSLPSPISTDSRLFQLNYYLLIICAYLTSIIYL